LPRKSPFRHKVRKHVRSGINVHQYERGKGKKPVERKVIGRIVPSQVSFRVLVDGRSYPIKAVTFASALDIGLLKTTKVPTHVRITREEKTG
jgi:hypothetical protein